MVNSICAILNELHTIANNPDLGGRSYKGLMNFVNDRPGHDRRYAINCDKIKKERGWRRRQDFKIALKLTVNWHLENMECIERKYLFRGSGFNE
ncbi:dTDP-glucose 4,6-dehydratase [bacterium BMS3Bbin07]|nr:dTDP-glucose 4,6-dehydratase [bacterium BMS3Bbin07]